MFNPQYVNKEYLMQDQYHQFKAEQQKEIKKAVKDGNTVYGKILTLFT